ncbi:hypothetical protein FSARC_3902 [Fusarium sarcochroum]|uniref:Uncharacterized protein n=1 Tax=Fusarium sarcochroum TaxID=1208366 RepID=A0A8H4U2W0_9HYPO|nr:hypothetical protein FSARC_3902 [Fusarium sarcochroum]
MYSLLLPLFLLLSFVVYVQCEESETYFILPATADDTDRDANNPRYKIGDNIKVRWLTDYKQTSVRVVQSFPNDTSWSYRFETNVTDKTSSWTAVFDDENTFAKDAYGGDDCIFWFEIYRPGENSSEDIPLVQSRSFNVSMSGTTESTSSSTSRPTSSESSESSDSDSDSNSDSGLSGGAGAGIAAGAIAGGLLIGGLGFLAWRHFRNNKGSGYQPAGGNYAQQQGDFSTPTTYQSAYQPAYQYQPPQQSIPEVKPELASEPRPVHEVP